jgi:hypothetical protein
MAKANVQRSVRSARHPAGGETVRRFVDGPARASWTSMTMTSMPGSPSKRSCLSTGCRSTASLAACSSSTTTSPGTGTLDDEVRCSHPRFGDIQGKIVGWTRIWAGTGRYGTVDLGVAMGTGVTGDGDVLDVDYTVDADPVAEPVIASSLGNKFYA